MIYADASFVVAVLAQETYSALARAFLADHGPTELVVSAWAITEVASALAMKERRRDIDRRERERLAAEWDRLRSMMTPASIGEEDFVSAASLVDADPRGLRAGDALHLAIVRRAGHALATLDRDLADAAEAIGVEVMLRPPA
ncbi:type II toxin-antitoxin system VapC family toxin [Sphingomonas lenta]|uniref:Ribonuclease VapC n=1 Tax=Sphingomonas lenta TaxID=1141887 RepID=A0A2A2SEI0_9SPHN|nr:type II toxin-antitoxin system VapC family toxin [Sphingomonas lenta]PAX07605.1 VapC toxin family PIN domain ribonuclease [Sphingomonas lenta]